MASKNPQTEAKAKKKRPPSKKSAPLLQKDSLKRCISSEGHLRAVAITAGRLSEEARLRHGCSTQAGQALGEGLVAALLLLSGSKGKDRLSLSLKGKGPYRQMVADADPNGSVRGFILENPDYEIKNEKYDEAPWTDGLVSVARLKEIEKEPTVSAVPALTGKLAKDLTFYLSHSEQVPSAVGIVVNVDLKTGAIDSAGGFLVQVLPGATDEEIQAVERNIQNMEKLAQLIAKRSDPIEILGKIFDPFAFTILEEQDLSFECNCSRDRVIRALNLIGKEEIESLTQDNAPVEVTCDFCSKVYRLKRSELLLTSSTNVH